MKIIPAVLSLLAAGSALAQVNGVVIQARVWNDIPSSTFVGAVVGPTATMSDQNVVSASGYANRHAAWYAHNGVPVTFSTNTYFDASMDFTFNQIINGARKEAGFLIGDSQFLISSTGGPGNAGEVVIFGGGVDFYSFPFTYVNNSTMNLRVLYYHDTPSNSNKMQIFAAGVASPVLGFSNLEGGIVPGKVGAYMQIPRTDSGLNGGTLNLSNITFNGSPVPEPSSVVAVIAGLGAFVARRRKA